MLASELPHLPLGSAALVTSHRRETPAESVAPQRLASVQVTRGVLYAKAEAEGTRLRNPYDTIVEVRGTM